MQLFDQGFLRSNFLKGTPVRLTAAHKQQNRVANILKYLYGVGCHIEKPTTQDGRGWAIVVDGAGDGATASLSGGDRSGPSTGAWEFFTTGSTSDYSILSVFEDDDPDGTVLNGIVVNRAGWYRISVHAYLAAKGGFSEEHILYVESDVAGSTRLTLRNNDLYESSSSAEIDIEANTDFEVLLAAGTTVGVNYSMNLADFIKNVRLSVTWIHADKNPLVPPPNDTQSYDV